MPSVSKKQHNFMEAVAHSPAFAKKVGIKQSVGKDFAAADKGKKFKGGGMAKENTKDDMAQDKAMIKKAFGMHDKQLHENKKTDLTKLKKGGTAMAKETIGPKTMKNDVEKGSNKLTKFGESAVQKRGKTKGKNFGDSGPSIGLEGGGMKKGGKAKCMASGGMASSRADGIASRGKTKGKWC
jgi:hypothetical protein